MRAEVTTLDATAAGSVELNDTIFNLEPRPDLIHRMVRWQQLKRMAGTHQLHAVVGWVARQTVARGNARDIRNIADDIGRLCQYRRHFGGDQRLIAGAEARYRQPASHGRRPWPCTTTIAK